MHRQFVLFAAKPVRDVFDGDDSGRDMPGGGIAADVVLYAFDQLLIELVSIPEFYKKNDPDIIFPILADDQAVEYFRNSLDLPD